MRQFCSLWLSRNSFIIRLPSPLNAINMSFSLELAKFTNNARIGHGHCIFWSGVEGGCMSTCQLGFLCSSHGSISPDGRVDPVQQFAQWLTACVTGLGPWHTSRSVAIHHSCTVAAICLSRNPAGLRGGWQYTSNENVMYGGAS